MRLNNDQIQAIRQAAAAAFVNRQNIIVDGRLSLVWPETLARKLNSI